MTDGERGPQGDHGQQGERGRDGTAGNSGPPGIMLDRLPLAVLVTVLVCALAFLGWRTAQMQHQLDDLQHGVVQQLPAHC